MVTLIGAGCGTDATLTKEAQSALAQADIVIGARRLVEGLTLPSKARCVPANTAIEALDYITGTGKAQICVVYSGDSGFYSGAQTLLPLLEQKKISARVLPGISSIQAFAAALGQPWQSWRLVSAHGKNVDPVAEVCRGNAVCFLTDSKAGSPARLCAALNKAGLGDLPVAVGENLTLPNQRIITQPAKKIAVQRFAVLSLLLCPPAPVCPVPVLTDGCFLRGNVPMTKQEVRWVALAKLGITENDCCWDIGGGTGSVAIAMAHQAKAVWSVEHKPEALALMEENRTRLCAWKLHIVHGTAPEALDGLPKPDAVFVGGSGGHLAEILTAVHAANPAARVCVSAIALETLHAAQKTLNELGYEVEVCQLSVSRDKTVGELHLMQAQNPVFLITGAVPCDG